MPWLGSVKQSWNTLSLPVTTSREEALGVSMKTRSWFTSVETERAGPVVTGPTSTCMPLSIRLL